VDVLWTTLFADQHALLSCGPPTTCLIINHYNFFNEFGHLRLVENPTSLPLQALRVIPGKSQVISGTRWKFRLHPYGLSGPDPLKMTGTRKACR
jgi:hypothetical protein